MVLVVLFHSMLHRQQSAAMLKRSVLERADGLFLIPLPGQHPLLPLHIPHLQEAELKLCFSILPWAGGHWHWSNPAQEEATQEKAQEEVGVGLRF